MERMGPRCAGDENGDGTIAGRINAVRAAAVTAALVAALAGCSVTVQPKNAAAARPLSSTPSPSAGSSTAPSTTASSSSPSPTPTPSDVDHTVCTNVREALGTLKDKLETDKESASRTAQDYRNAGYSLRSQSTKTKNSDLKSALKTIASDYLTVGYDAANHDSTEADLGKTLEASKPLATLCGGGTSSVSGSSTSSTSGSGTSSTTSSSSSSR